MDNQHLPPELAELADIVVPVLRRVYDINAADDEGDSSAGEA